MKIIPRLPRHGVPQQFKTTGRPRSGAWKFETGSRLLGVECGDTSALLSYALVHLVNFPKFTAGWWCGRMARSSRDGCGSRAAGGRSLWTLLLVRGPSTMSCGTNGGFALTHTARVQRTSGGTFTAAEVRSLVEAFTYFCWLCAEARCGPVLPVGFDGQDRAVWSRWNPTRTEPHHRRLRRPQARQPLARAADDGGRARLRTRRLNRPLIWCRRHGRGR